MKKTLHNMTKTIIKDAIILSSDKHVYVMTQASTMLVDILRGIDTIKCQDLIDKISDFFGNVPQYVKWTHIDKVIIDSLFEDKDVNIEIKDIEPLELIDIYLNKHESGMLYNTNTSECIHLNEFDENRYMVNTTSGNINTIAKNDIVELQPDLVYCAFHHITTHHNKNTWFKRDDNGNIKRHITFSFGHNLHTGDLLVWFDGGISKNNMYVPEMLQYEGFMTVGDFAEQMMKNLHQITSSAWTFKCDDRRYDGLNRGYLTLDILKAMQKFRSDDFEHDIDFVEGFLNAYKKIHDGTES